MGSSPSTPLNTGVRAVVFDIGATLVTGPPVAPNKVIAGLMTGVSAADVASVIMTTPIESPHDACAVLKARFGPLSPDAAAGVVDLWNSQAFAAREIEGASDTVLALKRRGISIGLLSDIWSPYFASVEKVIPSIVEAADAVVLSCRTGCRKPNHTNFRRVLEELDVEPHEAVMVGDTYAHDILPALQIGMRAVWVLARPERETDALVDILNGRHPAPTATVRNIQELKS